MQEEQEPGQGQDPRSSAVPGKGLDNRAGDLSPARRLRFAVEGIPLACPAEEAAAAAVAVREVPWVGVPGAREACGCSVALTSEACAAWGAVDLSDTGKADSGTEGVEVVPGTAAAAASARRGTVPMGLRSEETPLVETSEVGGTSLALEGEALGTVPGHNRADSQVAGQWTQRRRAAGKGEVVGKAAAAMLGTLAEVGAELVPSKTREGSFEVGGVAGPER